MAALLGELRQLTAMAACAVALGACASTTTYQVAAMDASDAGDQKKAISLAAKEVERFSTTDQCSSRTNYNCGTLALAYSALASYQILDGDRASGERSFRFAKQALRQTAAENRSSATGIVYRDVSEAFWRVGDKSRAIDVLKEGIAAGGDQYLFMGSAAKALEQQEPPAPPAPAEPAGGTADKVSDRRNTRNEIRPPAQSR
ncbi:MAG: hypothetical protein KIS73_06160 [Enhydrobacter sp.]|nr:hypothetical protein [Enhydrobacter sp.]